MSNPFEDLSPAARGPRPLDAVWRRALHAAMLGEELRLGGGVHELLEGVLRLDSVEEVGDYRPIPHVTVTAKTALRCAQQLLQMRTRFVQALNRTWRSDDAALTNAGLQEWTKTRTAVATRGWSADAGERAKQHEFIVTSLAGSPASEKSVAAFASNVQAGLRLLFREVVMCPEFLSCEELRGDATRVLAAKRQDRGYSDIQPHQENYLKVAKLVQRLLYAYLESELGHNRELILPAFAAPVANLPDYFGGKLDGAFYAGVNEVATIYARGVRVRTPLGALNVLASALQRLRDTGPSKLSRVVFCMYPLSADVPKLLLRLHSVEELGDVEAPAYSRDYWSSETMPALERYQLSPLAEPVCDGFIATSDLKKLEPFWRWGFPITSPELERKVKQYAQGGGSLLTSTSNLVNAKRGTALVTTDEYQTLLARVVTAEEAKFVQYLSHPVRTVDWTGVGSLGVEECMRSCKLQLASSLLAGVPSSDRDTCPAVCGLRKAPTCSGVAAEQCDWNARFADDVSKNTLARALADPSASGIACQSEVCLIAHAKAEPTAGDDARRASCALDAVNQYFSVHSEGAVNALDMVRRYEEIHAEFKKSARTCSDALLAYCAHKAAAGKSSIVHTCHSVLREKTRNGDLELKRDYHCSGDVLGRVDEASSEVERTCSMLDAMAESNKLDLNAHKNAVGCSRAERMREVLQTLALPTTALPTALDAVDSATRTKPGEPPLRVHDEFLLGVFDRVAHLVHKLIRDEANSIQKTFKNVQNDEEDFIASTVSNNHPALLERALRTLRDCAIAHHVNGGELLLKSGATRARAISEPDSADLAQFAVDHLLVPVLTRSMVDTKLRVQQAVSALSVAEGAMQFQLGMLLDAMHATYTPAFPSIQSDALQSSTLEPKLKMRWLCANLHRKDTGTGLTIRKSAMNLLLQKASDLPQLKTTTWLDALLMRISEHTSKRPWWELLLLTFGRPLDDGDAYSTVIKGFQRLEVHECTLLASLGLLLKDYQLEVIGVILDIFKTEAIETICNSNLDEGDMEKTLGVNQSSPGYANFKVGGENKRNQKSGDQLHDLRKEAGLSELIQATLPSSLQVSIAASAAVVAGAAAQAAAVATFLPVAGVVFATRLLYNYVRSQPEIPATSTNVSNEKSKEEELWNNCRCRVFSMRPGIRNPYAVILMNYILSGYDAANFVLQPSEVKFFV